MVLPSPVGESVAANLILRIAPPRPFIRMRGAIPVYNLSCLKP